MHEAFLTFLRVGVCLQTWLKMQLVSAVTSLNMDGFDVLVKMKWQFFAVFSASSRCIQRYLSHVTFIVSFVIILLINQHYFDKIQSNFIVKIPYL